MMPDSTNENGDALLITASEAAKLLHVSEKTLWNHTEPRGNRIPVVRFGKTLRYSRAALQEWIARQIKSGDASATG